ncbi:MAG: TonB-dependent receptor [Pedobacter sp.]|nr:MAG: TonB-dependent receptor [Pedobacter sp.]
MSSSSNNFLKLFESPEVSFMKTKATFVLLISMTCSTLVLLGQEKGITAKKDSVQQLQQVSIQGKIPVLTRKAGSITYNLEASAAVAGNPVIEVLRMIPGISVINDKISIRGKEGIIVMIDNRRSYLSGEELLAYLKNTPAESISQIEMISNPSSKYDAEGNVGIINIKTKRSQLNGATGSLSQTLGYGRHLKSTTGGQVTYLHNNLSIFGNSYLSSAKTDDTYSTQTKTAGGDDLYTRDHSVNNSRNNYAYQAGLDYRLNDHSTAGAVWDGSLRPDFNVLGTSELQKKGLAPQNVLTDKASHTDQNNNAFNLHYNWNNTDNTTQWNADVNQVRSNYMLNSTQNSQYHPINALPVPDAELLRNNSLRTVNVLAAKADYTHKWLEKYSIESGIKWSRVKTFSDLVYEQAFGDTWRIDPGRTNQYAFNEQIYAAYGNFNGTLGSFTIQAGIRGEYTTNTGNSQTLKDEKKNHYFKVFPSFAVSNTFAKDHTVDLTYSYRIDRPTYSYLNPFIFINNPYSYFRGNPYLLPQFSHNLEANYDYKKLFFLSLGYTHTTDLISEIVELGSSPGVIGGTRSNLNSMNSFNATINAPLHPFKNWTVNIYVGGFRNAIADKDGFVNAQNTFTTSANTSIPLPAAITLDLNGYYQTAMSYGVIRLQPMYAVNGGLRKSFLQSKLSLRLSVSDIFHTQRTEYNSDFEGIQRYGLNTSESTVVRATLSYKFGKIKSRKNRKTGVEDEQNRI